MTGKNSYRLPNLYTLYDLPEFQEFQGLNPQHTIDGKQTAVMFGKAIHWLSFLEVLWPPFEKEDYYRVWVSYLVVNDPREKELPPAFYQQIALTLQLFWTIQLENLYPNGDWEVFLSGWDSDIILDAEIRKRE